MLTIVLLLLLPAVLGMSVWRLVQLPRDLMVHRRALDTRRRLLCALGLGIMYCALAIYTLLVLMSAARALWIPPKTVHELLAVAYVGAGYPFVYLGFEWVLYYAVKPGAQA